jgi:hypothetical protein
LALLLASLAWVAALALLLAGLAGVAALVRRRPGG